MARKLMIFFWGGTLVFFALIFVVAGLSKDEGGVAAWYPMFGMFIFGACALGSTIAWLYLVVREKTRPPTSNPAVEGGRPANPGADHRER